MRKPWDWKKYTSCSSCGVDDFYPCVDRSGGVVVQKLRPCHARLLISEVTEGQCLDIHHYKGLRLWCGLTAGHYCDHSAIDVRTGNQVTWERSTSTPTLVA